MGTLYGMAAKVRRKIFVSYHHRGDQAYYDAFSTEFHDTLEAIADNSLERSIDSDDVDYVMRRIRDRYISGTSCTILLIGAATWGRKYIDWEIKATLERGHGLIGVQLPTLAVNLDQTVTVPERLNDNIRSGYAIWTSWADITSSAGRCTALIEDANARDRKLIVNARARRLRNAA